MSNLLICISAVFAMASCGNEGTSNSGDIKKDKIEKVAVDNSTVTQLNGVTDSNNRAQTGEVELSIKFARNYSGTAYIYETEGKSFFVLDSAKIENSIANFGKKKYETGFYMASVNRKENDMSAFIINPNEEKFTVEFLAGRLDNKMTSVDSKENEGWGKYYFEEKKFLKSIKDLKTQRYKSSIKAKFDPLIAEKEKQLYELQQSIIEEYPNTFLAKVVTYKHIPFKNDIGKFWSDIDMNDESLVHTTIISDRVQEFMITHSGATESGFINCVDLTKAAVENNPRILEFTLYTLLDGFYKSNKETVCLYIYDNYIVDEDCGADLSEAIKNRAAGVMSLSVGKVPPNIIIPTPEAGGVIDLYETVEAHDYTLIFYWASWCHKCEQEMPLLNNIYTQYKDKGFDVFGVSVDANKAAWEQGIKEKNVIFPNGSDLNQWQSKSAMDYRVTKTPTLFLLNKNKEIVLKPERVHEVKAFLEKNLK